VKKANMAIHEDESGWARCMFSQPRCMFSDRVSAVIEMQGRSRSYRVGCNESKSRPAACSYSRQSVGSYWDAVLFAEKLTTCRIKSSKNGNRDRKPCYLSQRGCGNFANAIHENAVFFGNEK